MSSYTIETVWPLKSVTLTVRRRIVGARST